MRERNGTLYLWLSDGTNARAHADGKSMCHNRRCIAKRVAWDCPHAVAAALYDAAKSCLSPVEKC
jgi:hypothetical protein